MANESTVIQEGNTVIVDATLRPRTLLLHTYEVERLLASGGMGAVYLVRHTELGTRHAVKIIKPELTGTQSAADVLELFRREAATLSGIRHDAVVSYEGFFRDEKRTCYLVMEFVDGPSLSQVLKQRALSINEVYRLRDRLAGGLESAHARGVTHRDLSPDNVILPEGRVEQAKLIDFGIAKLANSAATTIIGTSFAGKLRYAAPEQLGLFGGEIRPVCDIYSLGLVLAAAIGKPLAMGESLGTAVLARQQVPDLSQVEAGLRSQLQVMLQPDPVNRPQSMGELLRHWPRPQQDIPDLRPPVQVSGRTWRVPLRLLPLIVLGGLVLAMSWLIYRVNEQPSQQAADQRPEPLPLTDEQRAEQATEPAVSPPTAASEANGEPARPPTPVSPLLPEIAGPLGDVLPHEGGPETPMAPVEPEAARWTEPRDPAVSLPPAPQKDNDQASDGPRQPTAPSMSDPSPVTETGPGAAAVPAVSEPPSEERGARPTQPAEVPVAQPAASAEPSAKSQEPPPASITPPLIPPPERETKPQPPSRPAVATSVPPRRATPSKPPAPLKPKPIVKEVPKAAKAVPKANNQPRRSGRAVPARCGNLLSKMQLGEPLSASDKALLKECR
jgi:eukaryotic-like serine/threonine-protein kinase